MRVLILGEDARGGLMGSYRRGFEALGARVQTYCLVRAYQASLPVLHARAIRRVMESILVTAFNEKVQRELARAQADLVFVIKGHRLNAETIDGLRAATNARVVNFYPDDPFSEERSNRLVFGPGVLAAYDACFTFARHLIPHYAGTGVRAVHYLPFARDPELHAPLTSQPAREYDVVFVGNLDADRVAALEALAGRYRVAVFGERTSVVVPRRSRLARATFGPAAYGPALSRTLARGAISLNVMRGQNALSHNMRSFESPACGAFTLSQRTPELVELFAENEEMAFYGSIAELEDAVGRWLGDAKARAAVAAAGFARVRDDTYARRAAAVLDHVGSPAGVAA